MIQANELRIGNMFYWNGEILPNREIIFHPDKNEVVELSGFILGHLLAYYPGKDFQNIPLDPIPLTPEILTEWCGFSKTNSKVFRKDHLVLSLDLDLNGGTGHTNIALINGTVIAHPYKLHHLQNLWHSLYQRELEIKIPAKV